MHDKRQRTHHRGGRIRRATIVQTRAASLRSLYLLWPGWNADELGHHGLQIERPTARRVARRAEARWPGPGLFETSRSLQLVMHPFTSTHGSN